MTIIQPRDSRHQKQISLSSHRTLETSQTLKQSYNSASPTHLLQRDNSG